MIRIFVIWIIALILIFIGLFSKDIYSKVILTSIGMALILYADKLIDREYVKYYEEEK